MIRFRNPGTQYTTQIQVFRELYKEYKDAESFGLNEMAQTITRCYLMTAYGYAGDAALSLSDTDDTSRNSTLMNAKMYAEVFRLLGWIASKGESSYPLVNYLIVIDASVLQLGCEYKIFLVGTKLNYGDSDERTECVSGCSNGYCIALGCYSPNDDEKMKQAYDYSEKKGVLKYKFIEMPPKYDESKFIGYDVEMMDDCSGFQFHMITSY